MAKKDTRNDHNLVANLKALNFTEYEAKVYVSLIRLPPSTAYEISRKSGVPRPNTYSALSVLTERGAAMPVSERPVRYIAQNPDRLFRTIASETRQLCDDVTDELSQLVMPAQDHYVWNIDGDDAIQDKVAELIKNAQTMIWFKADPDTLRPHSELLRSAAIDRGVTLVIILFGTDAEEFKFTEDCKIYIHEASGLRMGTADNLFTIAVDMKEMLTANEENGLLRAALTENKAIVKMALSLIRHDLYMAEIFSRFKDDIDQAFGPHLKMLRNQSYTAKQMASFKAKTGTP